MCLESILYEREVLGKGREPIKNYKIRSMYRNAEDLWSTISEEDLDGLGHIKNDPRVTPVGRVLRACFIDELPQLYNVLVLRNMRWIGIRPRTEREWSYFSPQHVQDALEQEPGLVGIQYADSNLASSSFKDLEEFQEEYLRQWRESPNRTDVKYFFMVLKNIVLKGVRSK